MDESHPVRILLHLGAQPADVHAYDIRSIAFGAPGEPEQFAMGQDPAAVPGEVIQEPVLGIRKSDRKAVDEDLLTSEPDDQPVDLEVVRQVGPSLGCPALNRLDSSHKLKIAEWLRYVIVSA